MNRQFAILKWLVVILCISGCNHKTGERQYLDYLNDPDNKILQTIKVGEVYASMKWMPKQYRQMIEKRGGNDIDNSSDEGLFYFDAKLEKTTGEKPTKEKTLYLNFDIQKDFVLLAGTDSIAPAICQKVENGIAGSYEYMLAFEKPRGYQMEKDRSFSVIYNDKLFGIGTIAFVYDKEDIKKIPKLKRNTPE
jgi:hypothetical protein